MSMVSVTVDINNHLSPLYTYNSTHAQTVKQRRVKNHMGKKRIVWKKSDKRK